MELAEAVRSAPYDAIISRTLALPGELVEAAPALRLIPRHGVGYNNVDLDSSTGGASRCSSQTPATGNRSPS